MLKVGKIDYLNLYPVFQHLSRCNFCKFISAEPSKLNKMLYNGEIDISPSSSFEYLKNRKIYNLIDNFSISSRRKVLSVIFFSKKKLEDIDENIVVYLSPASASSNSLLKIIFFEYFNVFPDFKIAEKNELNHDYQLLIGDNALKLYYNSPSNYYIYDLAKIWNEFTKLPFVFALWIGNRDTLKNKFELLEIFKKILKKAIRSYKIPDSYKDFTKEEIRNYFQYIDYELTELHQKSLNLYGELLEKWKLI